MRVKGNLILDEQGRTLILRGVNLGGDSKIPFVPAGSEVDPSFLDNTHNVSFVGRPFPLEEAESHFKRLKKAGMTFLRFVITWEAIEHDGPGIYDEAYLAYLRKILLAADKEDIKVFIDPHQDVWSRWTGGDGAPAWTMEKLGMDLSKMELCGAAITKQRYELVHGNPYPKMVWISNYNRYAAATMFSLFFAGKTYAPDLYIDGENIQDFLQGSYIAALNHTRRRLKDCPNIIGWGSMNEPSLGFIGQQNLKLVEDIMTPLGPRPTPWQVIRAASGYPVKVSVYTIKTLGRRISYYETFNPKGISLFNEGFGCPWKQAGVWKDENGKPRLLRGEHFSSFQGRRANFCDDFLKPFLLKFINTIKEADEKTFFFIEGLPDSTRAASHPSWNEGDPKNVINAFHWYDKFSLFTKSFRTWFNVNVDKQIFIFGKKRIMRFFKKSLSFVTGHTKEKMNNMPCLLGEFGLAFDINKGKAFKTGDYGLHEKALSMYYDAADANLLHSTLWNYSASNTNKYGDGWNEEDLSIFSEGKERAAAGWKRPYPMATAGKLLSFNWDRKKGLFNLRFIADKEITAPTVVYLPKETFGASPKIETFANGAANSLRRKFEEEQKLLFYNDGFDGEVVIKVRV